MVRQQSANNEPPVVATAGTLILPVDYRDQVLDLAHRIGERGAARVLGINRQTLTRIIANLPLRAGTVALVRIGLSHAEASE